VVRGREGPEAEAEQVPVDDDHATTQRARSPFETTTNPLLSRAGVRLGHVDLEGVRVVVPAAVQERLLGDLHPVCARDSSIIHATPPRV
jgi:hypothetical protein